MKQVLISEELLRQAIETLDLAQALLEKSNHHMTVLSAYAALRAALEQPAVEPVGELANKWRKLAHQFDAYRMQALWHLKAMTKDPHVHTAKAVEFLSAPPPQPQQSAPVQEPVNIDQIASERYKVVPTHESMFYRWAVVAGDGSQQLYIGREVDCQNMARKFAGTFLDGAYLAASQSAPPADVPMLTEDEIVVALHVALPSLSYDSEDAFINGVRAGEQAVRQKAGLK